MSKRLVVEHQPAFYFILFLNQPHLTTFAEFFFFVVLFFVRLKLVAERRQPLREAQISRDEQKPT